jgi:TonB-linked outer membrane protein, SusC/RagA family
MRRLLLLLVAIFAFGYSHTWAQSRQVSGRVVSSEDNQPIPGVSVFVKGFPNIGSFTDGSGNYSLRNIPANATTLVFSSVGYQSLEANIGGTTVNVALISESQRIDEVLVVAYGTAKKSSFTGSISSVGESELNKIQVSNPFKALEGATAGVSIVNETGQPGGRTTLRIRGIGSINASSNPLIILDGSPYEGDLSSISTSDIESINVLKDAASAALYGARGANGVVIVTTKRGKAGETKVNFDGKIGYNSRAVKEYNIMTDPGLYYQTFWNAIRNNELRQAGATALSSATLASEKLVGVLGYNIYNVPNSEVVLSTGKLNPNARIKYEDANWNDWRGTLMSPQLRQEYNLSVSKGNDENKIYFSLGYLDDKGYNKNSGLDRFTSRLSFDSKLYSWLDFSASTQFSRTESNWTTTGGAYSNSFQWVRSIAPIYPIYLHDAEGKLMRDNLGSILYDWGEENVGINGTRAYGASSNLVATQDKDKSVNLDYYLNQSASAKIKLPWYFQLAVNGSAYGNWFSYNRFITPTGGSGKSYNGLSTKYKEQTITTNLNQILTWSKDFDGLGVNVMIGHENYNYKYDRIRGTKTNFLDPSNDEFVNAAIISDLTSVTRLYNLEGYFGEVKFDYNNKYYISGSLRRDGSSIFHPDNRWGTFWSVGGSWRINQESFLNSVEAIDNLKLKASYGAQGNDYLYLPESSLRSYTPYQDLYEVTSNGTDLGLKPLYKGRKDVTWEKNLNFNVGIEFSFLNGLVAGEFEYFIKNTKDLLFALPVPASTGFTSEPWNIGSMSNKGFEVSISSNIIKTDHVSWSVNANLTHFENKVTKLPEEFKKDGITRGNQRIIEGGSIYDFYMVKWAGVDPNNGDALYWVENDEGVFEKVNGKKYNASSRQKIGTALPDFYGGFGTSIEFFNFDFSVQFAYQVGGLRNDNQYAGLMHAGTAGDNWSMDILNYWTPENKNTSVPRIDYNNQEQTQNSDRFITDASFVSFRNVSLGYTLPKSVINRLGLNNLRLYFVVDNVALWSKRQGLDPRTNWSGDSQNTLYSPIRSTSFGLSINL